MTQVITNLLTNAFYAVCEVNDKRVSILVKDADKTVEILISDSGNGIPAEIRSQVFEDYFSTKPNDNEKTAGAGIGLSIARNFVSQHRGKIFIDPHTENTQFVVIFPKNLDA